MTLTHIDIDGGTLAIEVTGPPTGPLIICSPAMGDTRDAYDPLALSLSSAGYRVAQLDLRGHGASNASFATYGDAAIAEDYIAIIGALNSAPGNPVILIGASLSAGAAVIAEAKNKDNPDVNIAGMILIAPFLRSGASKAMLFALRIMLLWPWGPFMWRYYAATLWPGLGAPKAAERAESTTTMLQRNWAAFQNTVIGADHDLYVKPWLGKSKGAPVYVVVGDKDPDWSDPREEAKWVAGNFENADVLVVEGTGHAPMFEKPDVVIPGVLGFLEKIGLKA